MRLQTCISSQCAFHAQYMFFLFTFSCPCVPRALRQFKLLRARGPTALALYGQQMLHFLKRAADAPLMLDMRTALFERDANFLPPYRVVVDSSAKLPTSSSSSSAAAAARPSLGAPPASAADAAWQRTQHTYLHAELRGIQAAAWRIEQAMLAQSAQVQKEHAQRRAAALAAKRAAIQATTTMKIEGEQSSAGDVSMSSSSSHVKADDQNRDADDDGDADVDVGSVTMPTEQNPSAIWYTHTVFNPAIGARTFRHAKCDIRSVCVLSRLKCGLAPLHLGLCSAATAAIRSLPAAFMDAHWDADRLEWAVRKERVVQRLMELAVLRYRLSQIKQFFLLVSYTELQATGAPPPQCPTELTEVRRMCRAEKTHQ